MSTQQILLNVPVSFEQVIDLVKQLSPAEKQQLSEVLLTEQSFDDIEIPEEHKELVRERIKKYEGMPGSYFTWNEIEQKLDARK
jgi:predicted HAD superfamily phosphohydrolase